MKKLFKGAKPEKSIRESSPVSPADGSISSLPFGSKEYKERSMKALLDALNNPLPEPDCRPIEMQRRHPLPPFAD